MVNKQAVTDRVIRDTDGNWIIGFSYFLGDCNSLEAELWGIVDRVLIMLKNGFQMATIQTDSLEFVMLLTETEENDFDTTILRRA